MEDDKLKADESRRVSQHEAIKADLQQKVQTEVSRSADETATDRARADALGGVLKKKAVSEVVETEAEVDRARSAARLSQIVDYVFYLAYGILGLEILLELIGARQASGFKQFIDVLAAPLVAPFRGLLPDPSTGPFQLRLSYLVALLVYFLLHLAVQGLLRLFAHRKTEV